ncbi:MAG: hypothetical protein JRI59_00345 [Deltaproteobacteria bacterium]|nr:hypothetical protein [Deltaproteobacteria bacterium]
MSGKPSLPTFKQLAAKGCWLLLVLMVVWASGAWRPWRSGINPHFVERIKDGQTKKHEILLWFGDPQEVTRTPEGLVYKYISYKDVPKLPSRSIYKEPNPQSTVPFFLDENGDVQRLTRKTQGEIVESILTIRFQPDGETVAEHNYQKFNGTP